MISLVVAMDINGGIGKNNQLPWHLPNDLRHFKELTTGHTVIMGRKTFDSIGKPLPNRDNRVISRTLSKPIPGTTLLGLSIPIMREFAKSEEEVFVIGGEQIFKAFLPYTKRIHLTLITEAFDVDTCFPKISPEFKLVSQQAGVCDEQNKHVHTFIVFERK